MMGVKVGDRVRAVDGTVILKVGEIYEVVNVGIDRIYVDTGAPHGILDYPYDYFELAPLFAVGDKVRVVRKTGLRMPNIGTVGEIVEASDGYTVETDYGAYGYDEEDLEPVAVAPQPQPLRIEAGRYYRTRDGRKVGPATAGDGGTMYHDCHWAVGGVLYQDDGTFGNGGVDAYDLIAEWTDEPAVTNADIFDELEDWMADNPLPEIKSTTGFTVPMDAPEFGGKLDATAPTLDDLYAAKCMVETGVCTINEVRKHLGLGPVPRGHELARAA